MNQSLNFSGEIIEDRFDKSYMKSMIQNALFQLLSLIN
jgi:hypothetical protein